MSNSFGFRPQGANLTVAASTTSASVARAAADRPCEHLSITNPTNGIAFVRSGVGAQTAVIGDFAVPAGQTRIMRISPSDDTIAVVLNTGATSGNVYIQQGDGWS